MTANRFNSNTVGIEDPNNQIAICALYNDTLHRACAPFLPRKSIKYTTDTIATVELTEATSSLLEAGKPSLHLLSNPSRRSALVKFQIMRRSKVSLSVFDITGRIIANLFDSKGKSLEPGIYTIRWDGKDISDKEVASGVYFFRFLTEDCELSSKAIFFK